MTATERFLSYLDVDTTSDEASESSPSTPNQRAFAKRLVEEMRAMGIADARLDAWGYVYGSIPATCEGMPAIGLIAHMDTSDAVPGGPIRARIVHYEGGDIVLNEEKGIVLGARDFPSLGSEIGNDLIVTDGTTLLGCDDKAGVAEILTLAERFLTGQGPRHGKLCIAFTPDEEISRGAERFRLDELGADFGYTVDGGALGEVEYENFNAADAHVRFCGRSMHPGSAKDKMLNASTLAMEFHAMLPVRQTPENTDGYEGFFHLTAIRGCCDHAEAEYIVRDHDGEKFEQKKERLAKIAAYLNEKYGEGTVTLTVRDGYRNMREKLQDHMEVVARARKAMEACGLTPSHPPIRGGTDGATITYMGMPCPNLPTGGCNFHSVYEYVSSQALEKMVDVLEAVVVGKES